MRLSYHANPPQTNHAPPHHLHSITNASRNLSPHSYVSQETQTHKDLATKDDQVTRKLLGTLTLALLAATAAFNAAAQNSRGSLRGTVQDATQARIASAGITLTSPNSGLSRALASDAQGQFRLEDLTPGTYTLTVGAKGFAPATASVTVAVSATRDVTVTLAPTTVQQSATVQAQASSITSEAIDLTSAVHQAIVSIQDLEALPLPARSFANIAYLAPGTEPVEPSDPTKARITAVSTGGSSGLNNELSVDGGDNSDDFIGGFLQNYSPDAIREFNVRTAQEDADTGGTTAGSVILTTRSGTNQWHGTASIYDRMAALDARFPIENPAPNPKQPFSRQNYVGTLGGPIVKDKFFVFADFEHVHENASIAYSPNSITEFTALAKLASENLIPGVTSIPVPNTVPIPFRDYLGLLRFDWAESLRSEWHLRLSNDEYTTHNSLVQQGTLPSTGLLAHNNYLSILLGNQFQFTPHLVGELVLSANGLHLTQSRNSNLGFALAFPFSSTAQTISGFETFGDNQFATPITYFPSERNQEKYQFRYDLSYVAGSHAIKIGANLIHEPVLGGSYPGNLETLYQFPNDPSHYLTVPTAQFTADMLAGASQNSLGGEFSQNIQRFAFYAQDSWRATDKLTVNYGIRYSTTAGLFNASNRTQLQNPGLITLQALQIPLVNSAPEDDKNQFGPRIGFAYSPDSKHSTVIRAGFGLYFDDLAQGGWSTAFQAVNTPAGPCVDPVTNPGGPENTGCVPGHNSQGTANLIDPGYRTPYAIHMSGGVQHAFNQTWSASADFIHEQGNHGYRAYSYQGGINLFTPQFPTSDINDQQDNVPDVNVFHSDNRSSYNGLLVHLQGSVPHHLTFIANYTFSKAQTWGCVLGELFDYVNGVCDPLNPFAPGDYGPSGEDVRDRVVIAGTFHAPFHFDISALQQAESARPYTITNANNTNRISINGVPTSLDQFRATPYNQLDLRVSRPITIHDRFSVMPFIEFFNLYNRNNPGANYVTNVAALPGISCANLADPYCTNINTPTSPSLLHVPGGALGDFFGPGTTVGTPFAAQLGVRASF